MRKEGSSPPLPSFLTQRRKEAKAQRYWAERNLKHPLRPSASSAVGEPRPLPPHLPAFPHTSFCQLHLLAIPRDRLAQRLAHGCGVITKRLRVFAMIDNER